MAKGREHKRVKQAEKARPQKQPKINEALIQNKKESKSTYNPNSFYNQNPTWSFSKCDFDHEDWGLCSCVDMRAMSKILKSLNSWEYQSWNDILTATSGKRNGTRNHAISVGEIIKPAQKRLEELNLYYDELYSLRLTGAERLWGIIEGGVFRVIWYDPNHEICPSQKLYT